MSRHGIERDMAGLWDAYVAEEENYLSRLPVCESCGERVQSEYVWKIEGHTFCEDCARERFCTPLGAYVE